MGGVGREPKDLVAPGQGELTGNNLMSGGGEYPEE